jgi:O-antigen ligase
MLLSSSWSEHPSFVFRRAGVFMLVSFSLCILIDYLHRADLLLPTLSNTLLLVLVIDVLSMVFLYSLSIDHEGRWKGIHIHKNVAGGIMAIMAIYFAWMGFLGQRRFWIASVIAAIFLLMTASKTSFALFFGSLGLMAVVVVVRSLRAMGGLRAAMLVSFIAVMLTVILDIPSTINYLLAQFYGDITLTGRVFIWDYVLSKHALHPWLGYGYGSFWGMGPETLSISEDIPQVREFGQAHNGYLDILIQLGWVGSALFSMLLIGILVMGLKRAVYVREDWHRAALYLNLVFFLMLHNLLESTFLSALSVEWTFFFIAGLSLFLSAEKA